MRFTSLFVVALAISLFSLLSPSPARADEWNELTYFTFSAPVEIPGVALPAGTYMFKLADADGSRNVVRVLSQDGATVYSTFFTIPDSRVTATDKPLVTFDEAPAGAPEAIKTWFYPGDPVGREFVYPKDQAENIAAFTHAPVMTTAAMHTVQPSALKGQTRVDARKDAVNAHKNAPMTRANAQGQSQALQPTTGPTPSATGTTGTSTKRLPTTASTLPLVGLTGMLSLFLGLTVRELRRRIG